MFEDTLHNDQPTGSTPSGTPDGNWMFLLPRLDLDLVVCVGRPSPAEMAALRSLAHDVRQVDSLDGLTQPCDLIYFAGANARRDWQAVARLLTPQGVVYEEDRGQTIPLPPDGLQLRQCLWLTPAFGRMQTAVPFADQQTMRYFRHNGLASVSVSLQTFDNLKRWLWKRQNSASAAEPRETVSTAASSSKRSWKARIGTVLRKTRGALVDTAGRLEETLTLNPLSGTLLKRRGVLLAASAGTPHALPDYLQVIARENGLDISAYRWGYAARGKYPSQKLLFFLFEPGATQPQYLIKMVRHEAFNPNLEREQRGLLHLQAHGLVPAGTLPRTVLFGYHRGLAVIGESIVTGEPFETRSQFDAACPFAQDALGWLTDLGARTVSEPIPGIADDFQRLVDQYAGLYNPTPAERQFLDEQVAVIRRQPPPCVFEHGDPGTWNLLAMADGRVAFLDWENAAPQGVPLWDVLYFLRSYCIAAGRQTGKFGVLDAFDHFFLDDSAIAPLVIGAIQRYCEAVSLPPALVQPLFYLCWMLWAVKQAALVAPSQRESAHYRQLLIRCIERRDAPTLQRIFSL